MEHLLNKYVTGSITEEERLVLNKMINSPEYAGILEQIIDTELHTRAVEGEGHEALLSMIQQRLKLAIEKDKKSTSVDEKNQKPPRRIFYIARVAAVFLLLIAGGVYLWLNNGSKINTERDGGMGNAATDNRLKPGGNKAILKLADGTEIVLDSTGAGTVTSQGGVKVIKLADGGLAYKKTNGSRSGEVLYNTISTPKGGQYQLVLADGSRVWLNAASSLRFPTTFSDNQREVQLTGEGYFEIAPDRSMPFHVKINEMDIQVLGTQFNVNGYQDEGAIRATLVEGSVKVNHRGKESKLKPGQQAMLNNDGNIHVSDNVDMEEVVAWKNGRFQFTNADIKTILRQASRWYDVEFNYASDISQRFSGQIPRNVNAEELLKILEFTDKVQFEIKGSTIMVRPK